MPDKVKRLHCVLPLLTVGVDALHKDRKVLTSEGFIDGESTVVLPTLVVKVVLNLLDRTVLAATQFHCGGAVVGSVLNVRVAHDTAERFILRLVVWVAREEGLERASGPFFGVLRLLARAATHLLLE